MVITVIKGWCLSVLGLVLSLPVWAAQTSYSEHIQPIFTDKCVACHACYDAPCQLNLGSGEGLQRGAHQEPIYNGARKVAQQTTRLFTDATHIEGWREKGFYDVLGQDQAQAALLTGMLALGRQQPYAPNSRLPDDLNVALSRSNQCPQPHEFAQYAQKNPHGGMPFAVTGLTDAEHQRVEQWLQDGAQLDWQSWTANAHEQQQIEDWEAFLNTPGARESVVSRWIYEHLFIAHIYFQDGDTTHFFKLVRSRTPTGEPVKEIVTRRPNDDPGVSMYYRFVPVADVIVHKTHITYGMSPEKLTHVQALFFTDDWQTDKVPGYGAFSRSNPFETFAMIPARARYQFMLDDAEYFVRTFIRGPVCRGQIAADVIRDQFWTFFQDPEHDVYVTDTAYQHQVNHLLAMPGQFDAITDLVSGWRSYKKKRNRYENIRRKRYKNAELPDWPHLWSGNDQALLSIFRQHDSATVRKGLVGDVPKTMWLLDFPLLERTYYQLVVNFDVFGSVSHQAQTRLYFDLIRNGAEVNFLRLMPPAVRQDMLDSWYQKSGKVKLWLDYTKIDDDTQSALALPSGNTLRVFAHQLLDRFDAINARPDPINRCLSAHCNRSELSREAANVEHVLSRLASRPAAALKVIHHLPEATMVRVELSNGEREVYSVLRNREHTNVAFMMGESLRYQPGLDTLTVYPEVMSSYPNFIFNVPAAQIPDFVGALEQAKDELALREVVERWGIRRTHPQFWAYFHDLAEHIRERQPLEAGVLDMNRYENL